MTDRLASEREFKWSLIGSIRYQIPTQTDVETAMMPDVLLRLPLENLRMYGAR